MSVFHTATFAVRFLLDYSVFVNRLNANAVKDEGNTIQIMADFLDSQILKLIEYRRENTQLSIGLAGTLYQSIVKQLETGISVEDLELVKKEAQIEYPEGTSFFEIVMDTPNLMAIVEEVPRYNHVIDSLKQLRSLCD